MTALTQQQAAYFTQTFERMVVNISGAIMGKEHVVRLALTCLVAEGHLLLEDNPGTGKTVLAKAIANTVQGNHSRIQFTPDLLPSDLTGVNIYDQKRQEFEFHEGPIFRSIVLADEINRASPKTQSALLEAMEERQVTTDGVTRKLGSPFMVIATQNPIEQAGTYRLPEAQLDRFLMKTSVGYPDHNATVALLADAANRDRSAGVPAAIGATAVTQLSAAADQVYADPAILGYVSRIAEATREHPDVRLGVSVRGCLAYVRCAKAWAVAKGRPMVLPDDVKELAQPVLGHRLMLHAEAQFDGTRVEDVLEKILVDVPPPQQRGQF
jgi:MoxR-like ATPase